MLKLIGNFLIFIDVVNKFLVDGKKLNFFFIIWYIVFSCFMVVNIVYVI